MTPSRASTRVLHLVRHGQSTWNVEGRVQGQTASVPLTDLGRVQAAAAAHTLARRPVARVLSSDLQRAHVTALAVARECGVVCEVEPALREQHLGRYEGRLAAELDPEPQPEGVPVTAVRWGGGESVRDVADRLTPLLDRLLTGPAPAGEVVLVTHGDTLRVARAVLTGAGPDGIEWGVVPNGSVTTVEVTPDGVATARTWQPETLVRVEG